MSEGTPAPTGSKASTGKSSSGSLAPVNRSQPPERQDCPAKLYPLSSPALPGSPDKSPGALISLVHPSSSVNLV